MTIPGPKKSPVMQQIGSDVPFLRSRKKWSHRMGKTGPFVKHTLILYLASAGAGLCGFVIEDLVTWGMLSWPPGAKAILSGLGRQPSVSPIDRNATACSADGQRAVHQRNKTLLKRRGTS